MKFFKALSICCLVLGLAGCFPGERKAFEDQDQQTSSTRAEEIAVALADAVQNELSSYFISINNGEQTYAVSAGNDIGIVRTGVCDNGVYAYISADNAQIRGLDALDKGSGMQMVRTLQKRFGKDNTGYKPAQGGTITGIDNTRSDAACLAAIQGSAIADGSPIIAINFGSMSPVLPQSFVEKVSQRVHNCADINPGSNLIGSISKQCTTSYSFDDAGTMQLDQNDVPLINQDCEQVSSADIAQACQLAETAIEKSFQISEGIVVGTDWSAFFQNPGSDVPLTVKCVSVAGGEDSCEPFDPQLDPSIIVECDEDSIPVAQVINPIIQNGMPVSEIGGNGDIVDRSCGYGWTGHLTAEYQTRQCQVYDVDPDGNRTLRAEGPKQTIYQMYYVAADCQKDVENVPIACPIGQGQVFVKQTLAMNQPLALHPHNIARGDTPTSTIAVQNELNSDTALPADLRERINANYFVSNVNLNNATDENDFTVRLFEEMQDIMEQENTECYLEGQNCTEPVLPPITVALVDRSGSMSFTAADQLVETPEAHNSCKLYVAKLFEDPDVSCPLLNTYANSVAYNYSEPDCDEERYECEMNGGSQYECDDAYYQCYYGLGDSGIPIDDDLEEIGAILDGLKDRYTDDSSVLSLLSGISNGNYVNCDTLLSDVVGDQNEDGDICTQNLFPDRCQTTCPGECHKSVVNGPKVKKLEAVDDALRDVLVDQLQYGASFVYSFFSAEGINHVREAVPTCKVVDDPDTTADDNIDLCSDDVTLYNDYILPIKDTVTDIANNTTGGGTPLFQSIDYALTQLDAEIASRGETPATAQIAFYLMTDGIAGDAGGANDYNVVCDVNTNARAFSVGFKTKYPNGKLYILNLPGNAEDCETYAKRPGVEADITNPNKTVDRFFDFNTKSDHFVEIFGDTGVYNQIPPVEICSALGIEYTEEELPDDETVIGGINGCSTGKWFPKCMGYNGVEYPQGHSYCGPFCYVNGQQYPVGFSQCNTGGNGCTVNGVYYPAGSPQCSGGTGCDSPYQQISPYEQQNLIDEPSPCECPPGELCDIINQQ